MAATIGDAGGERFLHHLEGNAAAEEKDAFARGQTVREQLVADQFIERVMAADIFAQNFELA